MEKKSLFVRESVQSVFSASSDAIWNIFSNTERLNRAIGIPPIRYSSITREEGKLYRIAKAQVGPFFISWKEYPFEWTRPTGYFIEREFYNGPFLTIRTGVELEEQGEQTRVNVFAEALPRGLFGKLIVRAFLKQGCRRMNAYVKDAIERRGDDAEIRNRTRLRSNETLLNERLRAFRDNPLVEKVRTLLLYGADDEVASIRPLLLASHLHEDPFILTRLLLQMVRAGVCSLQWKVLCPVCRVAKAETLHLQDIPDNIHCDLCDKDIPTEAEDMIEMQFRIHPSIRRVSEAAHCIGGPYATPHIVAQIAIPRDEEKTFILQSDFDRLQLRALQKPGIYPIIDKGDLRATFSSEGWVKTETSSTGSRRLQAALRNDSPERIIAVIEDQVSSRTALTLNTVLALQEFRDFFSKEILREGSAIAIESLSFLFTDLTSSTSMYEAKGDAPAYVEVRRHFDLLKNIIAENNGAIVKTIGDAIMAVFVREKDCLNAGLQICVKANEFANIFMRTDRQIVRVGIYTGSAVVVSANDRMDYFGKTVNRAARIQAQSVGGDLVLPKSYFSQASCLEALKAYEYTEDVFSSPLKGIKEPFELVRLHNVKPKSIID
jgi:class 3 adenylate cyclase